MRTSVGATTGSWLPTQKAEAGSLGVERVVVPPPGTADKRLRFGPLKERGPCGHDVDRAEVAPVVEAADPAGRSAAGGRHVTAHTHLTRDMKPLGECPACDEYHRYVPDGAWYPAEPEPPPPASQGAGLAVALAVGLCLLVGAFAVWFTIWLIQILTTTP